ncbi:TPA: hypothetical protein ACPWHF_003716 [Pseudomonas aeruginosa]
MIIYYCIQVLGQAKFPYGKAGPLRTPAEARRALGILRREHPNQELSIFECTFFVDMPGIDWDVRYTRKHAERKAPVPRRATREKVKTPNAIRNLTNTAQGA